ncbi:hypothetical protein [Deinococcus phoenicis]|uniref:hypothetical protein n=1 Tax=Deinococcus phoenicis TaxID=1476583 RepID=UPI000688C2AB|nr:hypothetical protein [Deinococcus phoenicis]
MNSIDPTDFWQWAYSDFLSNALRGVLAEYIVAQAVGCTHRPRTEWDAYDLKTDAGLKIEVKSAASLQTWPQRQPSLIRFDIDLKRGWDAETNVYAAEATRAADVYVFCVFTAQDRATANPLNLEQWFFLICPTELLNQRFPTQKSVSLSSLEALGLARVDVKELGMALAHLTVSLSPA